MIQSGTISHRQSTIYLRNDRFRISDGIVERIGAASHVLVVLLRNRFMKMIASMMFFLLSLCTPLHLFSQQLALKTNLLYGATTTMNIGGEMGFRSRWSLDVSANLNPWSFAENRKFKHWLVQPELRRWNCETFNRAFWGVHLLGGQFNVGNLDLPMGLFPSLRTTRYEGWMIGGGVSYGYHWYLAPHWNIEATIGIGYIYTRSNTFECMHCGRATHKGVIRHYFGPTRIGLSVVYLFNHK